MRNPPCLQRGFFTTGSHMSILGVATPSLQGCEQQESDVEVEKVPWFNMQVGRCPGELAFADPKQIWQSTHHKSKNGPVILHQGDVDMELLIRCCRMLRPPLGLPGAFPLNDWEFGGWHVLPVGNALASSSLEWICPCCKVWACRRKSTEHGCFMLWWAIHSYTFWCFFNIGTPPNHPIFSLFWFFG